MYHFLYYLNGAKTEVPKEHFLGDWEGGPLLIRPRLRDVIASSGAGDEPCGVLDRLKFPHEAVESDHTTSCSSHRRQEMKLTVE